MAAGYSVPDLPLFEGRLFQADAASCTVRFEEEIKRSRFITTLARADSRERALAFVDAIKKEFPDARHNCWAYAAGRPGDTAQVGPMVSKMLGIGVETCVFGVEKTENGIAVNTRSGTSAM